MPSKQQLIDHVTSKSLLKDVFTEETGAANGQISLTHKDGSAANSDAPLLEIGMNNDATKKTNDLNDPDVKLIQNKFLGMYVADFSGTRMIATNLFAVHFVWQILSCYGIPVEQRKKILFGRPLITEYQDDVLENLLFYV